MNELDDAITLHRAGQLAEAEAVYRRILAREPEHAAALHLLGLIACQSGRLEEAAALIERAVARQPDNAEFHINLGEVQRRMGKLPDAITTFRRAVQLAPHNAFAHYNLAVALAGAGQADAAIAAYRQALALQPAFPEALNNLGLLLHLAGQNAEAADALRQSLALRPGHAEAENNLGLALWSLDQHAESLAAFTRAAQLKPDFAAAHANRALILRKLGQRPEALAAYQKAAELDPASATIQRDLALAYVDVGQLEAALAAARRAVELSSRQADAHHALGVVLSAAAQTDPHRLAEAIAAYEQALALRPGVPEWEFELADLRGQTPPTAPDAYVKTLFDEYALRFEHHLVHELNYRVPQELLAALCNAGILPAPRNAGILPAAPAPTLDILDLGCGTGLCGTLFRPHARSLTGIDLAPNMIALAQSRRDPTGQPCYDRLLTAHLLPALQQFTAEFDLILAADVFIYVGALDEVLPAAARALRPAGLLAFSLERHDGPARPGYTLRRRFAHSLDYIRELTPAAGLAEVTAQPCPLRNDVPPGWLVILRKPH